MQSRKSALLLTAAAAAPLLIGPALAGISVAPGPIAGAGLPGLIIGGVAGAYWLIKKVRGRG
jgi:hypothetical protein